MFKVFMGFMRNLGYAGLSAVVLASSSLVGCSDKKSEAPSSVSVVYEEPEPVFF